MLSRKFGRSGYRKTTYRNDVHLVVPAEILTNFEVSDLKNYTDRTEIALIKKKDLPWFVGKVTNFNLRNFYKKRGELLGSPRYNFIHIINSSKDRVRR